MRPIAAVRCGAWWWCGLRLPALAHTGLIVLEILPHHHSASGIASPYCAAYAAAEASTSAWRSASSRQVTGTIVLDTRGRAVPPSRTGARSAVRAPHGCGGCQARATVPRPPPRRAPAAGPRGGARGSRRARSRPSAHACERGRAPCAGSQARVARAWPPLLPQGGQRERLSQQHLTELAAIHGDRRPRIECPPYALLRGLVPHSANASGHLPSWSPFPQADL